MNLSDGQIALASRGFDYLDSRQMTVMLNAGKDAFEDAWPFPWLETVISGPAPLIIPDLKYVIAVVAGNAGELIGADVRGLVAEGADLTQAGAPTRWFLSDQIGDQVSINTWPTSSADLTVIYTRFSPELLDPIDTPLIPRRHHSLWIDHAVVEAYHDSDNYIAAQALRGELAGRMLAVIETYETRNRQHSVLSTVRGFSEDE